MADYRLIGTDQAPKDLEAKITGRARYSEDFRAEGMLFAKLLLSPVPRGRVTRIDTSRAEAMEGVFAVITADHYPPEEGGTSEPVLTMNPRYQGQPIAAVAAVDETTAANAVAAIDIDIEPLPFVMDPLDSLRPGGPNGLDEGNAFEGFGLGEIKWSAEEMAALEGETFPEGEFQGADGWETGDLEDAFARSDLIIEQPILHQTQTHHPLEPRSAMAYWENGRCYLYCSTQSVAQTRRGHADRLGIDESDMVLIGEFCGGGFGSKIRGTVTDTIPPALAREAGRPVMMRVTREEETYFGRARSGLQGWIKMGFRSDGRVLAVDQLLIQENGPFGRQGDFFMAGNVVSLTFQPEAMRHRGIAVITNTPPHAAQRGPGGAQIISMVQPVVDRAARELGVDRLDMMMLNAPPDRAEFGPGPSQLTSAYAREAIQMGREMFNWDEKIQLSGQRNGTKVTGVGASFSPFVGGSSGYDGMLIIRPDGSVTIHSGVGNLGTGNVFDTAMAAAEVLGVPWEEIEVVWGNTEQGLPWSSSSSGSQTTHAHTRANYATGQAARRKLQQIAAMDLGGSPEQYEVGNGRVYPAGNPSGGITFAQAAQRAVDLGGEYDGSELPESLDEMTVEAIQNIRGQGLVAAATDEYSHEGATWSSVVGFAVVEVDVETGQLDLLEMVGVADVGTVVNPRGLNAQISGGMLQGSSQARFERWAFDLRWGINANRRFYTAKPLSILDTPPTIAYGAVDLADPETPVGSRGVGEPPVGAGAGVITSAVMDAIGGIVTRTPLTPDKILNALEGGNTGYTTLQTHV